MVKFLKITAAIFLLLLVFFAGMSKYRTHQAEQTEIPKNATSLIQINIDELYKTIAVNVLSHPVYYFKSDFKKDTAAAEPDKRFTGLSIPPSIYLYNLANKPTNVIFSRLEIESIGGFESFIKNVLHLQITKKTEGINMAKSQPGNLVIYYNRKAAAFAIAARIENPEPDLLDILNKKNTVKACESKFKAQLALKKHVVFSNQDHSGWIDFRNGQIDFEDVLSSADILPADRSFQHQQNPDNTLNFYLNASFKRGLNQVYRFKNFSLESDSLMKYYNGNLGLEWTNSVTQTDSIITYEYNDNFEKVEKISLQKREIPDFVIRINADTKGLMHYLDHQNILNADSGTVNKTIFPLFKVFAKHTDQQLVLSSKKDLKPKTSYTKSADFFTLNINFQKLNKQLNLPLINPYLKNLAQLNVKGKADKSGKINIRGALRMTNKDINSLYLLLSSF
ncbi:hypothetical protein OC25_13035 [Pedobacter kyungheensis]|uniref:Uncharacterized protein n=1 Tax=Pedobacter kyungheensis TaxID=1069985 RepID=A0A0C1D7W7_9SPHI|nr:hypothetical protein [Pedobacter kyungheensis]KIA93356.1 hypothetical protein OC25_13035 [Pedobacter kyungheensis]